MKMRQCGVRSFLIFAILCGTLVACNEEPQPSIEELVEIVKDGGLSMHTMETHARSKMHREIALLVLAGTKAVPAIREAMLDLAGKPESNAFSNLQFFFFLLHI